MDASDGNTSKTYIANRINFFYFAGVNTSDVSLLAETGSPTLEIGDQVTNVSGSAFIAFIDGLSFGDLNPGSYVASGTSDDAIIFGTVTLNITAVPEPTCLAMFGVAMLGMLRRRRRLS